MKAMIFDLDGTLLDTLPDLAAACNYARTAFGLPAMETDWYRLKLGNGAVKLMERCTPQEWHGTPRFDEIYTTYFKYYEQHTAEATAPFDGIVPLLHSLRESGIKLGVVSNKPDVATQACISHYFPNLFDAVTGKKDGFGVKPDPASLLYCMQALGCGTDAVYVGDSDVDVYTAHNAQVPCAGACWGYRGKDELAAAGADWLCSHPLELLHLPSKQIM